MSNPFDDLNQLLQWTTRGENCVMCNSLRGRVYSYDTWMSAGVWPGFHQNCDCYLKKVDASTPVSDLDFFGTDLPLLAETINPVFGPFRLHWDPNYKPYSIYMTEEITKTHLSYGAGLPIGQVLKMMKNSWQGFFKRSNIYDNFFIWRVFRTVQHYQNIDGGFSGSKPPLFSRVPFIKSNIAANLNFYRFSHIPYFSYMLKPDSLIPWYPYQSYYTRR